MNKNYNLKLDLQFRCNNSTMKFNQFDNNTSDFFMKISNGGKSFDIEKAIVVLATIKPSGKVASQFVEVKNDIIYADLKSNMKDEIGTYTAQAMLILEDERVVTDAISYEVEEDKIFSLLNDTVEATEEFTLLTDMLSRLSTIEISEEQRMINEAERILAEENRKIEEAKRVEAELVRQHEEADRTKYDATRESNENIRKQNESIRLANETNRIDEEAKRVEEENKRKLAEEERKSNYDFMTEDEERRRSEANVHKEAEVLRVQAETNRVNEEAKRRTTEQARVSAENTRVSNENTRETNEVVRKNNENQRVEAETQRQNRYNSFISDAEANANNFENYTNTAKVKEEERKSNELDRKLQEDRRVSNEVERISNENTRKANEVAREKNETSRQNIFENKVSEVNEKIVELNTTKENFVSSVNAKVDNKIYELDSAKSDMTNTVSNKIDEVETRFNALTSSQQQDAEVIDARVDFKGVAFDSLKERIDYTDKLLRDSTVSTIETESDFTTVEATSNGYFEDVKLEGKTLVNLSNLSRRNITITKNDSSCKITPLRQLTSSDVLYLSFNCTSLTFDSAFGIIYSIIYSDGTPTNYIEIPNGKVVGYKQAKIVPKGNVSSIAIYLHSQNSSDSTATISDVVLMYEKDYDTQNPPSYFKGLKSVGQSASEDGADEIVVSSVKGDGNLFDGELELGDINGTTGQNQNSTIHTRGRGYTYVHPSKTIVTNTPCNIYEYNYKKEYIKRSVNVTGKLVLDSNTRYIRVLIAHFTDLSIDFGVYYDEVTDLLHQSDKKRLLYYNNETQAWEKPILRQWDSIEKHADGKYYYHQRSGEVLLNGSENWGIGNSSNDTTLLMYAKPSEVPKSYTWGICDKFNFQTSNNESIRNTEYIYVDTDINIRIDKSKLPTQDAQGFKQWLQANNVTAVYQLAQEKVYECTNIDLITYNGETNYIVESGAIVPRTTLKVHNNISNVVSLLQKKVSLLESNITSYMITQNRLMLASRYNADTVSFKVDVASFSNTFEYDNDLYELILNNILVGKDNYNREYIENLIIFYWMDFVISDEMYSTLFEIIEEQHNPKIIEEETPLI